MVPAVLMVVHNSQVLKVACNPQLGEAAQEDQVAAVAEASQVEVVPAVPVEAVLVVPVVVCNSPEAIMEGIKGSRAICLLSSKGTTPKATSL